MAAWGCSDGGTGPGVPSSISVTPTEATLASGETLAVTVSLRDVSGRELPTSGTTWTSSDLGVASVSSTGLVTALGAGGPVVVTAHAGPLLAQTLITVVPGEPTQLSIATQPSVGGTSGMAIDRQPVVQLRDAGGNVAEMAGVEVTAVLAEGQGTLSNATATTDASGRATFTTLTISGPSGDYRLRFEAAGLTSATSDVIVLSAIPAALLIITQPSTTAQSSVALARQPSVEVRDATDDPIVGAVVTASIASGGGAVGGTATAMTNASGRATFTNLSISGLVGVRTLLFTSGSVTATSGTIELVAGPLAQLSITTQPSSNAKNDIAFPQQPVVRAHDGAGNGIGSLTVAVALQSGGGSLGGTTTIATSGSGDATFTNLKITGTVGPRTLRFSSGELDATSGTVNLSAGDPVSVSILTQPPSSAIDGVSFQQLPQVALRDVSDNPVPGADVVASIASGGGTASGTTTVSTSGGGTATFSDLSVSIGGNPGPRTLRFSSNGKEAISSTVHVGYDQGSYLDLQYCGSIAAQRMDVYVPSNSVQRPLPVAVYIHGGSWTGHDKSEEDLLLWADTRQELLARGFVVATLNYRLATPSDNKWPAQIHDVKCAIRHLRAEAGDYGADGRIGVWGASAGGHLAAMVGVTDAGTAPHLEGNEGYAGWSSRVSAVITIGGISDLTQGPDHPEILFLGGDWAFETWPGPSSELNHASPLWWTSSDDPPFLIVHGEEDATVLYPQAPRLDDALDGAGALSMLVNVVNGGHELQNIGGTATPSIPQVMDQIADFFDDHVR